MSITSLQIANSLKTVTANDSTVFDPAVVRVGTGGDLKVDTLTDTAITVPNVQDGEVIYAMITRIYATGTTASGFTLYR